MTAAYAGSKPPSYHDDALAVLSRLRASGHVAYFAGGCVRDMVMGHQPKDYDVATDATPERVRSLFSNTQAVGAAFGVILVRHQKSVVEVATFRTDLEYRDGRRPTGVRYSTPREDAERRDFTINGMFFDPVSDAVIDYVGGREDIARRLLRAIGDPEKRFAEDHLRKLRAVRFAARFGLEIESTTLAAIARDASKLIAISPERIAEELRLMLTPPTRVRAWSLCQQLGFDAMIFRFAPPINEPLRRGALGFIEDFARDIDISFALALAGITLDYYLQDRDYDVVSICAPRQARAVAQGLRKALRLSNAEYDDFIAIVGGLHLMIAEPYPTVARLKRFLALPIQRASRLLLSPLGALDLHRARVERVERDLSLFEKTEFAPVPLLTGDNLTAAGFRPGPLFKRILDAVYDAQLEGRIIDRAGAIALAESMAQT